MGCKNKSAWVSKKVSKKVSKNKKVSIKVPKNLSLFAAGLDGMQEHECVGQKACVGRSKGGAKGSSAIVFSGCFDGVLQGQQNNCQGGGVGFESSFCRDSCARV